MPTLQKQLNEKFLLKLTESKELHSEMIAQLRDLLAAGKKPKVEEIMKVFQHPGGGDIK